MSIIEAFDEIVSTVDETGMMLFMLFQKALEVYESVPEDPEEAQQQRDARNAERASMDRNTEAAQYAVRLPENSTPEEREQALTKAVEKAFELRLTAMLDSEPKRFVSYLIAIATKLSTEVIGKYESERLMCLKAHSKRLQKRRALLSGVPAEEEGGLDCLAESPEDSVAGADAPEQQIEDKGNGFFLSATDNASTCSDEPPECPSPPSDRRSAAHSAVCMPTVHSCNSLYDAYLQGDLTVAEQDMTHRLTNLREVIRLTLARLYVESLFFTGNVPAAQLVDYLRRFVKSYMDVPFSATPACIAHSEARDKQFEHFKRQWPVLPNTRDLQPAEYTAEELQDSLSAVVMLRQALLPFLFREDSENDDEDESENDHANDDDDSEGGEEWRRSMNSSEVSQGDVYLSGGDSSIGWGTPMSASINSSHYRLHPQGRNNTGDNDSEEGEAQEDQVVDGEQCGCTPRAGVDSADDECCEEEGGEEEQDGEGWAADRRDEFITSMFLNMPRLMRAKDFNEAVSEMEFSYTPMKTKLARHVEKIVPQIRFDYLFPSEEIRERKEFLSGFPRIAPRLRPRELVSVLHYMQLQLLYTVADAEGALGSDANVTLADPARRVPKRRRMAPERREAIYRDWEQFGTPSGPPSGDAYSENAMWAFTASAMADDAREVGLVVKHGLWYGKDDPLAANLTILITSGVVALQFVNPLIVAENAIHSYQCDTCCTSATTIAFQAIVYGGVRNNISTVSGCIGYDVCLACGVFFFKRAFLRLLDALHPTPSRRVPMAYGPTSRLVLWSVEVADRVDRAVPPPGGALVVDIVVGVSPYGARPAAWHISERRMGHFRDALALSQPLVLKEKTTEEEGMVPDVDFYREITPELWENLPAPKRTWQSFCRVECLAATTDRRADSPSWRHTTIDPEDTCPICLQLLESPRPVIETRCGHWFHMRCIADVRLHNPSAAAAADEDALPDEDTEETDGCPVCRMPQFMPPTDDADAMVRRHMYKLRLRIPAHKLALDANGMPSEPILVGLATMLSEDGEYHNPTNVAACTLLTLRPGELRAFEEEASWPVEGDEEGDEGDEWEDERAEQ